VDPARVEGREGRPLWVLCVLAQRRDEGNDDGGWGHEGRGGCLAWESTGGGWQGWLAGSLATFTWMDRALRPRAPHSATGQHRAGLGKLERGAT
jgi:hypothetical protein